MRTPNGVSLPIACVRASEGLANSWTKPSTTCSPIVNSLPRQLHSTNPLERLNGEIKKRTRVVGIFPNEAAIVRLVGAILLEQNDEWAVTRRYMSLETFARLGYENVSASAALTAD